MGTYLLRRLRNGAGLVGGGDEFGAVAVAAEAGAVAGGVADGAHAEALLGAAGVEGRVDVDEGDGLRGEGAEDGEVIAEEDLVHFGNDGLPADFYHVRSFRCLHPTI
jgi:outer membrane lipoprotein SlyB